MRYQQYRLAKRNGEIVHQTRYVECITKLAHPRWQFWNWSTYKVDYDYSDWMDMPMIELFEWKQGDRVLVKQTAGFHKGAVGTVEFVEPSGKKVWVKRDGATNAAYFHIDELEPETKI